MSDASIRFQKQMAAFNLLIIDELGFVPLSKTGCWFPGGESMIAVDNS